MTQTDSSGGAPRLRAALAAALLIAVPLAVASADPTTGVIARSGDKLSAEVDAPDDGDRFTVELAAGGKLTVSVKGSKKLPLRPSLALRTPDGEDFVPPDGIAGVGDKHVVKLKGMEVPAGSTGVWELVVGGADGTTGPYTASFKVAQPKKTKVKRLAVAAGAATVVPFAADEGAAATVTVKLKDGGLPAGVRVVGPDGVDVPGGALELSAKGGKLKKLPLSSGFGEYAVVVDGGIAPAEVDVTVAVKWPKIRGSDKRKLTLPPETRPEAPADGDVRQEAVGRTLTVTGTGFRAGTAAIVSGEGVSVDAVTVVAADTLAIDVSVSADAPFGPRDLTIVPPPLDGEPTTLADALRVLAPVPTISGTSTPVVRQDDGAAEVVVTGSGFRAGCGVDVPGPGIALVGLVVDSPTQLTLTLDVDALAPLGPRDVTYTQPVAGGGDAVTAPDLVRVEHPVPVIDAAAPASVRQGGQGVVVALSGGGFRDGCSAAVSGTGVTVGSVVRLSDTALEVTLDVAADATYGARDVTVTQPAAGGGAAGTGTGVLTVLAPDPVVTSLSPAAVTQGDTDVLVTLTGDRFRDGATVDVGAAGLTVAQVTRVSETQLTFRLDVDADATLGPRSLTYAQPAAGGGASAVLADALQVNAPAPGASSISISSVKQLDQGVEVTFTGSELRSGGTLSVSGTGVSVTSTTVDSRTSARATLDVEELAPVGMRDVTFTQPAVGGARSATLTDALTVLHPDPTITGTGSVGVRRTTSGTLRVLGSGFRSGGTVTTTGTGVTLGTPVVVDGATLDLPYTVDTNAPLTTRDLTYTQPAAGGGASVTRSDAYGVFSSPPTFTAITPDVIRPGDTFVPCVVTGAGFEDGSSFSFGASGVTVESADVVSPTRVELLVSAASTAPLGASDLLAQPPQGPPEPFADAFTVVPADPAVTAFSHATLARGADDVEVEVHGTGFRSGDTLAASGSGVTFANVVVEGPTRITADVDVGSTATLGARDLTVSHAASVGGRSGTLAGAFDVIAGGPTVSSISPATIARTPQGGVTRVVTARVTGTGFMSGAGVRVARSGGSGISVVSGSVRVLSATELEVRLSVAGGTTTGTWDVTVTNPGSAGGSGTSGDDALSVVDEFTLAVNQVLPPAGAAYGGERVVVHGGGFVIGSVVDFGSERALRTQVIDENTLVCTVPQPAAASRTAPTEVTVTVTPPSSSGASRTDAYAYARDVRTPFIDGSFPADGATGVPATLARSCVRLSVPAGTLPTYSGSSATFPESSLYWYESSGSGAPSGAAVLSPDRRWIVFTRDTTSPLAASSAGVWKSNVPTSVVSLSGRPLVEITKTSASGEAGYDQLSFTISTTASDTTAPTVSSSTPAASASNVSTTAPITIVMSEEIDPLTVTTTNVTLKRGSTTIGCHVGLGDDLRTITISPHAELATSTSYRHTVTTGVRDVHGNALASSASATFTTSSGTDSQAPTIDAVVIEGLPASVDGSGTYVAGVDSTGSASNPTAANPGATTSFDLFVPRSGFELRVEYSDDGGVGVDASSFSATCSVAVGSASAGTELASLFDVTAARAVWRVPGTAPVAAGENVVFSFSVADVNGNTSSSRTVTLDVAAASTTSQSGTGGDLDPFGTRQTWVLRSDLDAYTSSYFDQTVGSITYPRMTSTNASNDVNDLDEALLLVGLATDDMTSDAASTTNGPSVGTNQIVRRLVMERIRALTRERFGIDADGTRDGDAPEIELLLAGEQGSLTALPAYASSHSTSSSSAFSEISIGGTQGAESDGRNTSGVESASSFDVRNLAQEALVNTDGTYGVFLTSMLKSRLEDGRYDLSGGSQAWRGMVRPFGRYVLQDLNATWGGTPVGEHGSDDDVLAASFDRSTSTNTTHNDRYDAIFTAIETVALWASCNVAAEIGEATGLVPDGGPKTGLFGHAHRNNAFTDATSSMLNVSHRIYWAGANNLLAPSGTLYEKLRTGSDMRRFNPLAMAWLRRRVLHDEGQ